jgi:ketosteroid isomerase-like protein
MRAFIATVALIAVCLPSPVHSLDRAPGGGAFPQGERESAAVLRTWFRHVERNELDALRALVTNDFQFVSDGKRMGPNAFVAMIKGLGIRSPRVTLKNLEIEEHGDVAYLVYDRDEAVHTGGSTHVFPETGLVVLVRRHGVWRIARWAATSPAK